MCINNIIIVLLNITYTYMRVKRDIFFQYQTGRTKELKAALQRQKEKTDSGSIYDSNVAGSPFADGSFYYNFKTPQ